MEQSVVHFSGSLPYKPLELDADGVCARVAVRQCVEHCHEWTVYEQDRASALLKDLIRQSQLQPGWLLNGASSLMLLALVGLTCGIEGRNEAPVYPELRWSHFLAGVVCFRAGAAAPLTTKQFEVHREYLEQVWRGAVSIETVLSLPCS